MDYWDRPENQKLLEEQQTNMVMLKMHDKRLKARDEFRHRLYIQEENYLCQLDLHPDKELMETYKRVQALRSQIIKIQPALYTDTIFYTLAPREEINIIDFMKVVKKLVSKKWLNGIYVIEQRGINDDECGKGLHLHLLFKRNGKSLQHISREFLNSVKNVIMDLDSSRDDYKDWLKKFHNFKEIKDEDVNKLKEYILGEKDERNDKTKRLKQTFDEMVYKNKSKIAYKKVFAKSARPLPKAKLVSLIKNTMLKQNETKNNYWSHGKIELYHNAGSPASGRILPTPIELDGIYQMPSQGVSDIQRIGDSIQTRGIKVRMLLGHKNDRPNVTFRVIVVQTVSSQVPASIGQLFDNQTGNILLDSINTDRVKVIYSKTIKKWLGDTSILSTEGGHLRKEITYPISFYIKTQRKINFSADAGKDFSGAKTYMYVFAYDAWGTLIEDNIAYCQTYSNLYYKDP